MTGTRGSSWSPTTSGGLLSRVVLDLPPDLVAARSARHTVADVLRAAGRDDWSEAAQLACTELVTNAVLHAHSPVTVTVEVRPSEVYVAVGDTSPDLPRQRPGDDRATTGRGMRLVARLASEHGVRRDDHGKTVWFTLRTPSDGTADEESAEDLLALWDDTAELDEDGSAMDTVAAGDRPRSGGAVGGSGVRLLGVPATLWLAAEEHHRTVLRELVLYLAEHPCADVDMTAADTARTRLSNVVHAAVEAARTAGRARRPLPEDHPAELPWVPDTVDVDIDIDVHHPEAPRHFAALQDALDCAERLAAGGDLLARPGLPEIVAVRDWACEQVLAQSAGAPVAAWPGTDHERFLARDDGPGHVTAWDVTAWDVGIVRSAVRPVVAADDSNRIVAVSPAMADLLGWVVDDLVGRRVVTLIPPQLREAHVAGFSRHLSTGEARLLWIPLELPVLRADGTEIRCAVLIEQAAAEQDRRLHLAWFELAVEAPDATPTHG